jgi:hypothetical protein
MEAHLLSNIEVAGPSLVSFPRSIGGRVTRARSAGGPRDSVAGRLVLCALAYEELAGGGSAAEVVRLAEAALADDVLLEAEGPACMPMYRAVAALILCDELDRAETTVTRAMAEARRLASASGFAWASAWHSYANQRRGRLLEAEADARAGIESGDQYLSGYGLSLARMWMAICLTEQGRLDEAREELAQVSRPDPPSVVSYALIDARARFHLAAGEYESAAREFELCRRLDEPTCSLVEWRTPASGFIIIASSEHAP